MVEENGHLAEVEAKQVAGEGDGDVQSSNHPNNIGVASVTFQVNVYICIRFILKGEKQNSKTWRERSVSISLLIRRFFY